MLTLSYLGGGNTSLKANVIAPNGHLFIAGSTAARFPVRNAEQPDFGGGESDGFLAEFDSAGALVAASYVAGPDDDEITSLIALDDGGVVAVGHSGSRGFVKCWSGVKTVALHHVPTAR